MTCIDVYQRERQLGRPKSLLRQTHHHNGVFATGKQQRRFAELRRDLPHNEDRFRLQLLQVGELISLLFAHVVPWPSATRGRTA